MQPGRYGSVLKTELNDIAVYNTVAEAMDADHRCNVAVVYVPPAGAKAAAEGKGDTPLGMLGETAVLPAIHAEAASVVPVNIW